MKIEYLQFEQLNDFINFNKEIYPNRDQIEESVNYRFFCNPYKKNAFSNIIIAKNEKDDFIGQYLVMPARFYMNNIISDAVWGMDYFVKVEYRHGMTGIALAKKALKIENHFGVGLSHSALVIQTALKEKYIGKTKHFVHFRSVSTIISFLFKFRKKSYSKLPSKILLQSGEFQKIESSQIWEQRGPWNPEVIEFSRDIEFMKWRFFYVPGKYFVYKYMSVTIDQADQNPTYFVVRPVVWKGIDSLLLVDYRFSFKYPVQFCEIIRATKSILRTSKLEAIITCSSLSAIDKILLRKFFFFFGKGANIVTNAELLDSFMQKKHQDNIFLTFADSDADFYFGNNKW